MPMPMQYHLHGPSMVLPLAVLALLTLLYLGAAWYRQSVTRPGWSLWRTSAWMAGAAVLALGLLPHALPFPPGDFRQHMLQHVMIGMLAPLGLVMAAPITLALRTLPQPSARLIVRALR